LLFFSEKKLKISVDRVIQEKNAAMQKLDDVKKNAFDNSEIIKDGSLVAADKIVDFGKFNQEMLIENENFLKFYQDLSLVKKYNIKIGGFQYNCIENDIAIPKSATNQHKILFYGLMTNKDGDIEKLLTNFDSFAAELKLLFPNYRIKYPEIPRNIDFTKKYYDMKIQFTLNKI